MKRVFLIGLLAGVLGSLALIAQNVPADTRGRVPSADTIPLYYDRAHGTEPASETMIAVSNRLGLSVRPSLAPITAAMLTGVRVLYLRAPSKRFQE